jgi:hypothetical protein
MWHGPAHLPNSGMVKEIITNGFSLDGVLHDCIRLHTEHKTAGDADGMAYGVLPPVVSGKTYTYSFYYRAATQASIGASIHLEMYTNGSYWPITSYLTVNSMEWKRYTSTVVVPATGNTNFYWFPSKGSTIDIAEIQLEEKSYVTPFVAGTRNGTINDISSNNYDAAILLASTPKWTEGSYSFDGVNDYIPLPAALTTKIGSNSFTISSWIKTPGLASGMSQAGIISLSYGLNLVVDASGNLKLRLDDGTNLIGISTNGINLFDNNYHYVTASYGSNEVKLYIDGVLNTTSTKTFANRYTNSGAIGYDSNNSSTYRYKGYIDEIKIYSRVLSEEEIKYQYDISKDNY